MIKEVQMNPCFREINACQKRYRILFGSAGSGKSMNVALDYILKLSNPENQGANLLCVRKSENSNFHSTYAELCKAVQDIFGTEAASVWEVKANPMTMTCLITGSQIIFRGCNDSRQIEKIKSITFPHGSLTWIWCEEATELAQADLEILDDRLRGVLRNPKLFHQITLTFNPVSASHWIKRVFFDISSPDVMTHHSTYLDNRFIDSAYHARMERRKVLDPEGYKIYGLGQWGETGGLIFPAFETRVLERAPASYDDVAYGQDFGFNHANALLELGFRDNNVYVIRELVVTEKDTAQIIALAKDWNPNRIMFCDCAEPDRIQMWRRAGFRAVPCEKGPGSVKAQIDWLKQRRIIIDPSCVHTIEEIRQYRWQQEPVTGGYLDEPVCVMDDAMAALRYGVQNWRLRPRPEAKEQKPRTVIQRYREHRLKRH